MGEHDASNVYELYAGAGTGVGQPSHLASPASEQATSLCTPAVHVGLLHWVHLPVKTET